MLVNVWKDDFVLTKVGETPKLEFAKLLEKEKFIGFNPKGGIDGSVINTHIE